MQTATSNDYYAGLSYAHQREVDREAAYSIALKAEIEDITARAENGDEAIIEAISEFGCSPNEFELHYLAFGAGAWEDLKKQRNRAIQVLAEKNIEERKYDGD